MVTYHVDENRRSKYFRSHDGCSSSMGGAFFGKPLVGLLVVIVFVICGSVMVEEVII